MKNSLERLYRRRTFGIKPGLDAAEAMLSRLGRPETAYGALHVAGTNGKGSVCAMADAVLRAAGLRVGLYTSPHLVRFNERIRVDGEEIPDADLAGLVAEVERAADAVAAETGREPTFFECATCMGLEYFRRRGVSVAVLETGMGGRLDATNVVTPLVSAITRIGLDHAQYLGPDIESIAREKAGIVKPGRPVVCGRMPEAAMEVVKASARERRAPFIAAEDRVSVRVLKRDLAGQDVEVEGAAGPYGKLRLPLAGAYQVENLATVVAAVEVLGDLAGAAVGAREWRAGLRQVRWPGRFQALSVEPLVIVDGAHNPSAAEALVDALKGALAGRPLGLVLAMCGDKDVRGFIRRFRGVAKRAWAVSSSNERSLAPRELAAAAAEAGVPAEASALGPALEEARQWALANGGAVCVTGSLFLAGDVLAAAAGGPPRDGLDEKTARA